MTTPREDTYPLRWGDPPPTPQKRGAKPNAGPHRSIIYRTISAARPGQAFDIPIPAGKTARSVASNAIRTARTIGAQIATRTGDGRVTVYRIR